MTEPGASPEDPWVKASPVGAHAGEGRAGRARAHRGSGRLGDSLQSPELPPLLGPWGCREDSSHPVCAKVGRQLRRVRAGVRGRGWGRGVGGWGLAEGRLSRDLAALGLGGILRLPSHPKCVCMCVCVCVHACRGGGLTGFSLARCRRWSMPTATTVWTLVSASPTLFTSGGTLPLQPDGFARPWQPHLSTAHRP